MNRIYEQPEYQVGAQFLNVELPNVNGLTQGITSDRQARISGTDPAGYARDTLQSYLDGGQTNTAVPGISGPLSLPDFGKIGRGVAFSVVGLLILALGLSVMVKQ